MSKVVEVMARGMSASKAWPVEFEAGSAAALSQAALSALDAAGFVVVPKEPTAAARGAALATAAKFNPGRSEDHIKAVAFDAVSIYRAMLSASQVTP